MEYQHGTLAGTHLIRLKPRGPATCGSSWTTWFQAHEAGRADRPTSCGPASAATKPRTRSKPAGRKHCRGRRSVQEGDQERESRRVSAVKSEPTSFDERVIPYFFNTHGKLCSLRLASMVIMIVAWIGSLYYVFGTDTWHGMPGIIIPLILTGFCAEIRFVVEQAGHEPVWGGLDPLGWATDYNGHPSTHRVKTIVSAVVGCILILSGKVSEKEDSDSGATLVVMTLLFASLMFMGICGIIERRGHSSKDG